MLQYSPVALPSTAVVSDTRHREYMEPIDTTRLCKQYRPGAYGRVAKPFQPSLPHGFTGDSTNQHNLSKRMYGWLDDRVGFASLLQADEASGGPTHGSRVVDL